MTTGRLTRQELGWLLAQEARGAAKILRQDVTLLTQPPPAPAETRITELPDLRVHNTLNALDDAIGMLTELEAGPASAGKGGRRGRIDLAALLWELAPNANISIEPGAGTEVFGEEAELRRMLHVLFSQTNFLGGAQNPAGAPVQIRREGEWVRISAELGPDISASTDIERRWLSRMATRMGGQLELEGGTLAVLLPADASNDQNEVADLRKELEQAQQLGEAYARELATAFSAGAMPEVEAHKDSTDVAARRFDLLLAMARAVHRSLLPVFRGLQAEPVHGGDASTGQLSAGQEVVAELGRLAACPSVETEAPVDVSHALREAAGQAEARAARHGVRLAVDTPAALGAMTSPKALSCLLRGLVEHAIAATPRHGTVRATARSDEATVMVEIADGGAAIPAAAHADLVEHRVDPASLGRPPGLALTAAHTIACHLGSNLLLRDSAEGGLVVELRLRSVPIGGGPAQ